MLPNIGYVHAVTILVLVYMLMLQFTHYYAHPGLTSDQDYIPPCNLTCALGNSDLQGFTVDSNMRCLFAQCTHSRTVDCQAGECLHLHYVQYLRYAVMHGCHLLLMALCCLLKLPNVLQHHNRHAIYPGSLQVCILQVCMLQVCVLHKHVRANALNRHDFSDTFFNNNKYSNALKPITSVFATGCWSTLCDP